MKSYILKHGNDSYVLKKKSINLDENDFSYTESGNDITITAYNGSDSDVTVVDRKIDLYMLARPGGPVMRHYTITYDETEYTATPEEGYGLVITDTTKQDVDLSTDFIISQG